MRSSGAPPLTAFDRYAAWYDAFNRQKDYDAEARYVLRRARQFVADPVRWLDVGCGTGRHLGVLQSLGLDVEGVDMSPGMITRARAIFPRIPFHVATSQDFRLEGGRDVVSLLFHVMSYQVSDVAIHAALARAAAHLGPTGVVMFDFWNSDAVLGDPPVRRVREAQIDGRSLVRIATPSEDRSRRRVDVRYEFRWDSPDGPLEHEELHALRHFSGRELAAFLHDAGMTVLACDGWAHDHPLARDWYGFMCAGHKPGSRRSAL